MKNQKALRRVGLVEVLGTWSEVVSVIGILSDSDSISDIFFPPAVRKMASILFFRLIGSFTDHD